MLVNFRVVVCVHGARWRIGMNLGVFDRGFDKAFGGGVGMVRVRSMYM